MKVEIRSESVEISGYVNAVGRESRPLRRADGGYFTEIIQPGTFARALMRGKREMLLNHDQNRVIGTEGDNLTLTEDAVGLFARATITDAEVMEKARNGELRGWSFGFVPIKQRHEERNGMQLRTLEEIELHEVSIIDKRMTPAYVATSVFTRSMEGDTEMEHRAMDYQDVETVDATETRSEPDPTPEPVNYQPYFDRIEALKA